MLDHYFPNTEEYKNYAFNSCRKCGHVFSALVSALYSEGCPHCGREIDIPTKEEN